MSKQLADRNPATRTTGVDNKVPQLSSYLAFCLFLAANITAAIYSPIQDCDEVFNYWEPTHYLNHGYGLQTWEYSPEYAIRSWAYTGLHAILIRSARMLPLINSKTGEFYLLRSLLALICACCETRLYSTIARTINPRVAIFFLMILVFSPGMYHASAAYLPSSFAMYTTMLGFSEFMARRDGSRTAQGVFWFALGTLLGWPFAGALILPFLAEGFVQAVLSSDLAALFGRLLDGSLRSIAVLMVQVAIDSAFYRKLVCVPVNIVLYNVFSGGNKGPDIYGTEPWTFYLRNLFLNFNAWALLATVAFPLLLLQHVFSQSTLSRKALLRSVAFVSPFYLWLTIFTLQPHKEERFMYPAYPALALNAALALHILLANFGSTSNPIFGRIPSQVKLLVVGGLVLLTLNVGALRTAGLMTAYSAPLAIYKPLHDEALTRSGDTICLGKEWYRFPSSYLLPDNTHVKFLKSEFSGLLPGEFAKRTPDRTLFAGTYTIPPGMNDENLEDPSKYTNLEECSFLVDSRLPGAPATALEPDYIADAKTWETLHCQKYLDASQTPVVGRIFWLPNVHLVPERFRRVWGEYCLLKRREEV